MSAGNEHRFQVDLSGVIELLSHHLYATPAVFVRELLQNAVDAASARRQQEPAHHGEIEVEFVATDSSAPTLIFKDDGIGLTEDEVHQFLATIGQSSKRGVNIERPSDFLGQFGIGLLSGFMVTDEIVVITRSAKSGDHAPIQWRGRVDGTYQVKVLDTDLPVGTQVFLQGAASKSELLNNERILNLLRHYGEYLPIKIRYTHQNQTETIDGTPPWKEIVDDRNRDALLEYGQDIFGHQFLDVLPLESEAGGVEGVCFVLAQPTQVNAKLSHRIYLKNMLLSDSNLELLPNWAFFAQCVVNSTTLRPTASRESFYEDDNLELTRDQLGACLRQYLLELGQTDKERLQGLINTHHLAIKALALEDSQCLALFADWLPFETSLGTMTLGEFRKSNPTIRYVSTRDEFRQIAQVAAAESMAVINAGYVFDSALLERVGEEFDDVEVELFDIETLSDRFQALSISEREDVVEFERLADAILQPYKCVVEVAKFQPTELPAFYVTNENSSFLRNMEQAKDNADELWGGVLQSFAAERPPSFARLYLNFHNPLVQRICSVKLPEAQRRCIEMLYVQALLLGHFPLSQQEFRLLGEGVSGLIHWALDTSKDFDNE